MPYQVSQISDRRPRLVLIQFVANTAMLYKGGPLIELSWRMTSVATHAAEAKLGRLIDSQMRLAMQELATTCSADAR